MLQNPLVVQIITGIVCVALYVFGFYFFSKHEHSSGNDNKYLILSITVFVGAALGAIYFFCNVISTTPFTFGNMVIAYFKVLILVIIALEIFLYFIDEIDEGYYQAMAILIPMVVLLLVVPISGAINESIYYDKVIEQPEQKYQEEQYELISIFNEQEIEGAINASISTNAYYNTIVEEINEDTTEVAQKEVYEICYIKNSQKMYKQIDAEDTAIIPLKKGEKPYLLIKTYTRYGIDYNQEPTVEYIFEDKVKYELHVPMKLEEEVTTN